MGPLSEHHEGNWEAEPDTQMWDKDPSFQLDQDHIRRLVGVEMRDGEFLGRVPEVGGDDG